MNRKADPVTIEVVRNLLMSIAEETNTVIIKSAYSTNIKERRDNTTAIMDPAGNVVVQVESSIPMLLAALLFAARGVVAEYKPEDIHPGDMFIVNDPVSRRRQPPAGYHGCRSGFCWPEAHRLGRQHRAPFRYRRQGPRLHLRRRGQPVPGGYPHSDRQDLQGRKIQRRRF